jgi:hypothetical protein
MLEAHRLFNGRDFDVALFDRALLDGLVRMDFYRSNGVLEDDEHSLVERYMMMDHNRKLFDMHIFLVCRPETTLARKAADEIIYIPGRTTNPDTLELLYRTHRQVWDRLGLQDDPKFLWVDTDEMDKREVVRIIAEASLDALESKLTREGR